MQKNLQKQNPECQLKQSKQNTFPRNKGRHNKHTQENRQTNKAPGVYLEGGCGCLIKKNLKIPPSYYIIFFHPISSNQIFIFSKQWNFRVAFSVCVIFNLIYFFLIYFQASTTGKITCEHETIFYNNQWSHNVNVLLQLCVLKQNGQLHLQLQYFFKHLKKS